MVAVSAAVRGPGGLNSLLKNGFLVRRSMFRRVQGVRTAGKSHDLSWFDLTQFDDVEIGDTDKPQRKSGFSTGC
jgi:hypothetical protein